jgi:hypothetical protein
MARRSLTGMARLDGGSYAEAAFNLLRFMRRLGGADTEHADHRYASLYENFS